jgi:hypothetical protein
MLIIFSIIADICEVMDGFIRFLAFKALGIHDNFGNNIEQLVSGYT